MDRYTKKALLMALAWIGMFAVFGLITMFSVQYRDVLEADIPGWIYVPLIVIAVLLVWLIVDKNSMKEAADDYKSGKMPAKDLVRAILILVFLVIFAFGIASI